MSVESAKPPAIDDDEFENPSDYKPQNDAKDNRSLKKQKKSRASKKINIEEWTKSYKEKMDQQIAIRPNKKA